MRPLLAPEPAAPVESAAVPTFSVIIAAYQVADLIGEAIESVLGQTTPPLEIVVCDDGSTDDLQRALAPYRDKLILLRQPNRGESAAKNAAAAASSGDYVVILDAGRATLEINDPPYAEYIDEVEVGHRVPGRIRVAFEVPDTGATTADLVGAGAELVASRPSLPGTRSTPGSRGRSSSC